MKKLIVIISLFSALAAQADITAMDDATAQKIANAIYKVEGGANTKFPYGIKSVQTSDPRKVCLNTIKNNWARWNKTDKKICYLDFLADKYCPPSCDKQGNINWKKNIKSLIK